MYLQITLTLGEGTIWDSDGNYNPCVVFEVVDELLQKVISRPISLGETAAVDKITLKKSVDAVSRAIWIAS